MVNGREQDYVWGYIGLLQGIARTTISFRYSYG